MQAILDFAPETNGLLKKAGAMKLAGEAQACEQLIMPR